MSVTEGYAIVVHGGAGSPRAYDDGCARAAEGHRERQAHVAQSDHGNACVFERRQHGGSH